MSIKIIKKAYQLPVSTLYGYVYLVKVPALKNEKKKQVKEGA